MATAAIRPYSAVPLRALLALLFMASALVLSSLPASSAGTDEPGPTAQPVGEVDPPSESKPSNLAGMAVGAVPLGGWATIGGVALERQRRRRSRGFAENPTDHTEPPRTLPDISSSLPKPETRAT